MELHSHNQQSDRLMVVQVPEVFTKEAGLEINLRLRLRFEQRTLNARKVSRRWAVMYDLLSSLDIKRGQYFKTQHSD